MPIASSSAMCLSRATGSRPVQPAMKDWSMASVRGVEQPLASITLKVRSNTDRGLYSSGKLEDAAVGPTARGQHQADRHLALAMGGKRDRAAIDHVDQRAVAERAKVFDRKRLVVGK